jgi:5-methylthioadenosine/S-adenosylhomocysteine deaminase
MTSILLKNCSILTMNRERRILRRGTILIENDCIIQVGQISDIEPSINGQYDVLDLCDRWVLPGLINTHVHQSQQLARGLADDVDLLTWLRKRIWPYESSMTEEDSYISSLLCGIEQIRSGVTCFAEAGGQHLDGMGRAVTELGLRAILTQSSMDMGEGLPAAWNKTTDEMLAEQIKHYERWHGKQNNRIQVWFGLRTIFNNSDELIVRSKELADRLGVGVHMHVAEVRKEVEYAQQTRGNSTVNHLDRLGVLDSNFLAVHTVWLNEDEIRLFAERDVKVSHNPAAAMRVLGFARIPEMRLAGICVALGTDGAPANNRMTLIDEMWLASLIHKGRLLDPTVMPAEEMLQMVTIDGARALLSEKEIGSIEPGKKADLIVINPNSATMLPMHDPVANMVSSLRADNVESVMVDGVWLMRDRKILCVDEASVLAESKTRAAALAKRAGILLPDRFPSD